MSEPSAVADQRVRARSLAMPQADQSSREEWDGVFRFALGDGEELELPHDGEALHGAVLGIYVATGNDGLTLAWNTVLAATMEKASTDAGDVGSVVRSAVDGREPVRRVDRT